MVKTFEVSTQLSQKDYGRLLIKADDSDKKDVGEYIHGLIVRDLNRINNKESNIQNKRVFATLEDEENAKTVSNYYNK